MKHSAHLKLMKGFGKKMTKLKNPLLKKVIMPDITAPLSNFGMEVRKIPRGAAVGVSGAVSVFELTDSAVGILCSKTRLRIVGEKLTLVVFEGRRLEVSGRVEEIEFKYGKG